MVGISLSVVVLLNLQTSDPTFEVLDKLVAQYRELHLPIPPPEAPLVFTGGWADYGDREPVTSCGYLISVGMHLGRDTMVMSGTIIEGNNAEDPVPPVAASAKRVALMTFGRPLFDQDSGLAMAVIERTRGHNEFALALLKESAKHEPIGFGLRLFAEPKSSLKERMDFLALQHWANSIITPDMDRATVLKELQMLCARSSKVRLANATTVLIKGLKETVKPRVQSKDPLYRLVDSLCETRHEGNELDSSDPARIDEFKPLIQIAEQGFAAIPALIDHLDDKRFTRAIYPGTMNDPPALVTVGQVCGTLLNQFLPGASSYSWGLTKSEFVARWKKASKLGERGACKACLTSSEEYISNVPLRWAEKKFPNLLLEVTTETLEKHRKTPIYSLLEAMERTTISRRTIADIAIVATNSVNLDQVHAGIWTLRELDKPSFNEAIIRMLKRLPTSATGPDWLSQEASFAQQAACSGSIEVWSALLDATKRADVDLRYELIEQSMHVNHSKAAKSELVKYLAAFFDDTSELPLPIMNKDGMTNDKHPFAHAKRIQDLATLSAGSVVGMKEAPAVSASRKDWDAYRRQVQTKIKAMPVLP